MRTLGIILARGGSKGLPRKNILPVAGRPMVAWTVEHAHQSGRLDELVLSTDDEEIAAVGRSWSVAVVERPDDLADDSATVDSAARHALETAGLGAFDAAVLLYGNVPVRPPDLTDRAVDKLATTRCDSVQSVCGVGKMHPYWMQTLVEGDRLEPFRRHAIYRRQDLPPVYVLDGGVAAVTVKSLRLVDPDQPHAFLGDDRRAIVTEPGEVVDVDSEIDLRLAEAILTASHVA